MVAQSAHAYNRCKTYFLSLSAHAQYMLYKHFRCSFNKKCQLIEFRTTHRPTEISKKMQITTHRRKSGYMKYHELDQAMQKCRSWKVLPANCLVPISKCAYKKRSNRIKKHFKMAILQPKGVIISPAKMLENTTYISGVICHIVC